MKICFSGVLGVRRSVVEEMRVRACIYCTSKVHHRIPTSLAIILIPYLCVNRLQSIALIQLKLIPSVRGDEEASYWHVSININSDEMPDELVYELLFDFQYRVHAQA